MHIKPLLQSLKCGHHFEGINGNLILKEIFKNNGARKWTEFAAIEFEHQCVLRKKVRNLWVLYLEGSLLNRSRTNNNNGMPLIGIKLNYRVNILQKHYNVA